MRWKTRGEIGSTGSVRAMRGVVGIVLAVAATIAPNVWAQNTQPQAAQDCESQMPAKYAEVSQSYPPGHGKLGGRPRKTEKVAPQKREAA